MLSDLSLCNHIDMNRFQKEFFRHLKWTTILILLIGTLSSFKNKELSFSISGLLFIIRQFSDAWIGLCGPYFFLQIICYLMYRRFFYLTFFSTYFLTPKGFKHEPKDGVFTGLWFLLVLILVLAFPTKF